MFREEPADASSYALLTRFKAWCKKYAMDMLIIVVLASVFFIVNSLGKPHIRYVTKDELYRHLHHPRKQDTVPSQLLPVFSLIMPSSVVIAVSLLRRDTSDLTHGLLGVFTAVFLNVLVTDLVKTGVGRPRPDFFYRCFPDGQAVFAADGDVACTGDPHIISEGRKSFPSGHTSLTCVGMGYIALFVGGKLGCFDKRGHLWRISIASLPLWFAGFVAVSRISDYRHHWQDVLTGAAIGLGSAYVCYRRHYPSLKSRDAFSTKSFIRLTQHDAIDL